MICSIEQKLSYFNQELLKITQPIITHTHTLLANEFLAYYKIKMQIYNLKRTSWISKWRTPPPKKKQ